MTAPAWFQFADRSGDAHGTEAQSIQQTASRLKTQTSSTFVPRSGAPTYIPYFFQRTRWFKRYVAKMMWKNCWKLWKFKLMELTKHNISFREGMRLSKTMKWTAWMNTLLPFLFLLFFLLSLSPPLFLFFLFLFFLFLFSFSSSPTHEYINTCINRGVIDCRPKKLIDQVRKSALEPWNSRKSNYRNLRLMQSIYHKICNDF